MALNTREESEAVLSLSTPWAPLVPSIADGTIGADDAQVLLATLAFGEDEPSGSADGIPNLAVRWRRRYPRFTRGGYPASRR